MAGARPGSSEFRASDQLFPDEKTMLFVARSWFISLDCYTQIAYSEGAADAAMTVVETERFLKDAKSLMSDSERAELVAFVGANPGASAAAHE